MFDLRTGRCFKEVLEEAVVRPRPPHLDPQRGPRSVVDRVRADSGTVNPPDGHAVPAARGLAHGPPRAVQVRVDAGAHLLHRADRVGADHGRLRVEGIVYGKEGRRQVEREEDGVGHAAELTTQCCRRRVPHASRLGRTTHVTCAYDALAGEVGS